MRIIECLKKDVNDVNNVSISRIVINLNNGSRITISEPNFSKGVIIVDLLIDMDKTNPFEYYITKDNVLVSMPILEKKE